MTTPNRIHGLSTWLFWITTAAFVVLPLLVLYAIVTVGNVVPNLPGITVIGPRDPGTLHLAALIGALPLIPLLYALMSLRGLFDRYRHDEVLTAACARLILRAGTGLLLTGLMSVLAHTGQGLILSWANPPGQRQLSFALDSGIFGFLLAAAVLAVIGRAMGQAAAVAEENRGFI